uniref:Uncharacterized protein n=1 Tax=Peronospora matthiolae TaxID=2874970 RepID=A0AAV1UZ61_9STRA
MDIVQHAAIGSAAASGGLTIVQCLLARRVKPPSSLALSLGAFTGVFRLLEGIGRKVSTRKGQRLFTASQAAAFAAAVASLLLDTEKKTIIVSYAVVQAALNALKECTKLPDVKHIGLSLGALVTGPLIDLWIYQSDAIAPSQLAALDSFCQLPPSVLRRMRDELPAGKLLSRCDVFHRGQTCAQFHRDFFINGMKFAMRLHVPIYAVSVLAPEYKRWIYGPRPSILLACATVRMAGALTTLAFLLEHKHRRGSIMKTMGVYVTGALAARAAAALAIPPKTVKLGQLVLLTVAVAVLFRDVTPDSSRMARMLFGYSHEPALVDDERTGVTASQGDETTGAKELAYRAELQEQNTRARSGRDCTKWLIFHPTVRKSSKDGAELYDHSFEISGDFGGYTVGCDTLDPRGGYERHLTVETRTHAQTDRPTASQPANQSKQLEQHPNDSVAL